MKSAYRIPIVVFCVLLLAFCLLGCKKHRNPFPKVAVNFTIYPNDPTYLDLNLIGGSMYFTGGINGIVVYRLSEWEFLAYDRACPYDWDDIDEPRVAVEDNGITLKCPKCGSMFGILDGGIIKGPAKYPLKQYYTNFDGMKLRVHS